MCNSLCTITIDTITVNLVQKPKDQWLASVNQQQVAREEGQNKLRLNTEYKFEPVTEPM